MAREEEMLLCLKEADLKSYEDGEKLSKAVSYTVNSLVSSEKEIRVALQNDKSLLIMFRLITALACVQLAYEWSMEKQFYHPHWDERKKAAGSFAYKNAPFFEKEVRELIQVFPLYVFCGEAGEQTLRLSGEVYKNHHFVRGFLEGFRDTHPTLKQSFIRLAYKLKDVLYANKKVEFIPPLDYESVFFPFI